MNKQKFPEKYPYLFVIILEIVFIIVSIIVGAITIRLKLPEYFMYGGIMAILAIITAFILWKLNWWKKIGFKSLEKKYIPLIIIPIIPLIGNLFGSYKSLQISFYIYYFFLNVMVGFVEEGIYRGLMLRALLEKGVWKAVIISTFLFSLSHLMNALAGWNWGHVLLQLCYSFAFGFGWSAFALRTGTIWPLMLIHFLNNFFGFIKTENVIKSLQSSQPDLTGIIYIIILSIIFMVYGVLVIKSFIKEKKHISERS